MHNELLSKGKTQAHSVIINSVFVSIYLEQFKDLGLNPFWNSAATVFYIYLDKLFPFFLNIISPNLYCRWSFTVLDAISDEDSKSLL